MLKQRRRQRSTPFMWMLIITQATLLCLVFHYGCLHHWPWGVGPLTMVQSVFLGQTFSGIITATVERRLHLQVSRNVPDGS